MTTTSIFDALLERKRAIERELRADVAKELKDTPDQSGWWLWLESGHRATTELILLSGEGRIVASDDEFEQAAGMSAEQGAYGFNYWEGTDTTQAMMPGKWLLPQPA